MQKIFAGMAMLLISITSTAQYNLKGKVREKKSGNIIAGATIEIQDEGIINTKSDGSFFYTFKKSGNYTVNISSVGYNSKNFEVSIRNTSTELNIILEERALLLKPIEISSLRAADHAPFAKTNLSKADIEKNNLGQDIPFILNNTPSVVVTSDAGNGIGYTGLRIRGSDATRINMTINGIPYNDAESQGIFFVNLPDLASSVSSVQIQRGVGTSSNGGGAFGASMNFSTNEFNEKSYIEFNNSFGDFNTLKNTLKAGTGLINNHFTFDARLSQISSDGFIDRGRTDLKSMYLSGAYIDEKTSIRFNILSGKEKTYQAWNGIPEAKLRNQPEQLLNHYYNNIGVLYFTPKDSANLFNANPRRLNVYLYDNQTDNYQQDHYQFFLNHAFNKNIKANLSLFYSKGAGYYEQYRNNNRFSSYGLPNFEINGITIRRTDLVRRLQLDNDFYGGLYSLQYTKGKNEFILGGGISRYDGDHFGTIPWAQFNIPQNYKWYDFTARKDDINTFLKWTHRLSEQLELFSDLQYRNVVYQFTGTRKYPDVIVNETYHFINPKFGITYRKNNYTVYASYALGNKEPNRDDFEREATSSRPLREQLHNIETGITKTSYKYNWNVNVFYMRYKDQLVLTGRINDVGDAVRANVPNSYRLGIELQGAYKINRWLETEGNLTWSRNRILNYTDFTPSYDANFDLIEQKRKEYTSTPMSFSPDWVGSWSLHVKPSDEISLSLISKAVSDQFMDNTANEKRKLNGYFVQDLRWTWGITGNKIRKASIIVQLNNIWNLLYETNGYTYSYIYDENLVTENFFFPKAGRNGMIGVNIKL
ncbi:MAG: TonB-dependent receptor [Bacteroidota bacterium]